MDYKSISLFSGAMGLDLGLEEAGFKTAVAVENDKAAVETIKQNRPDLPVLNSIEDVKGSDLLAASGLNINDIALVAGGPPCQAFSVFGNRLGLKDSRGQLIFEYVRIIEELRPKVFILENVRGLLSMPVLSSKATGKDNDVDPDLYKNGSLIKALFKEFNKLGYRVDCFVVNAVNYGAPQLRERILLIGNRYGLKAHFPQPTHSNRAEDKLPPFKTLGEAISPASGFFEKSPDVMDFSARKKGYLAMIPPGGNWRSLPEELQKESMGKSWYLKGGRSAYWRKLSYDFPSPTVVTMPNHAGTSMCHPTELRAISAMEAAAIQEFPRDWQFYGSASEKFRQIGNAVPVRLGAIAGQVLRELLLRIEKGEKEKKKYPDYIVEHIRPHVRTRTFWKNGAAFSGNKSYYGDKKSQLALNFDSGNEIPSCVGEPLSVNVL